MRKPKLLHILQALVIGGFAAFTFGLSHFSVAQPAMGGMEHMHGNQTQCRILCVTGIMSDAKSQLVGVESDNNKGPFYLEVAAFSLLTLSFTLSIKKLYLLTSWRPPDKILLYGHYADGL